MEANDIKRYCRDMLSEAKERDPVCGRYEQITKIAGLLCGQERSNVILIGEPGVGKTALVEGLAQRIVAGDVPDSLKGVNLYALDVGELLFGTRYRGDFEEKFKGIMKEIWKSQGNIILFIDEIHLVLGAGSGVSSNVDMANLMKHYLARKNSRVIGATTSDEFMKYISVDLAFTRRFEQFLVEEPSLGDTRNILRALKTKYESRYHVRIRDAAVVAAVEYSSRYLTALFQPDKAINLMDQACLITRMKLVNKPDVITHLEGSIESLEIELRAIKDERDVANRAHATEISNEIESMKLKLETEVSLHYQRKKKLTDYVNSRKFRDAKMEILERAVAMNKNEDAIGRLRETVEELEKMVKKLEEELSSWTDVVGPEQIAEVVNRKTGIPVASIGAGEKEILVGMKERLQKSIVGQEQAVTNVFEAVLRSRTGFNSANKPIGSFLFAGPTGVGKTELAKALSRELFGDDKFLIRLDMSEFMEARTAVSRLVGVPAGSAHQGGQLTEPVRIRPYSVVLLDEIEKADKSVLNLLLQLFKNGKLSNSCGQDVDFTNTVIIMTSNLGAEHLVDETITVDQAHLFVNEAVRGHFRPELIHRIDDIVIFHPLSRDHIKRVCRLLLGDVINRVASRHSITLQVTDQAVDFIILKAFSKVYGARPIKNWIERNVVTQLSWKFLMGEIIKGSSVVVDHDVLNGEHLSYTIQQEEVDGE